MKPEVAWDRSWNIRQQRHIRHCVKEATHFMLDSSVGDPDVFGSPGSRSGSVSQRYGSGSFCHQAKIIRKTLIPTVLWLLYDFLTYKNDENVPSKINTKQKKIFFVGVLKVKDGNSRIRCRNGSIGQRHESVDTDTDPYQNVTDPQHSLTRYLLTLTVYYSSAISIFQMHTLRRVYLNQYHTRYLYI